MSQENVETVRQVYAGWEAGDFSAGLPLLDHNVSLVIDTAALDGGVYVGLDGVREYMTRFLSAWESLTIAGQSFRESGDTVLVQVEQAGIGSGSGARTTQTYFQLWTFRGPKVVRLETMFEEAEALKAAGLSE
jgi:ketosteroid isomerase-like protein